MVKKVVFSAKTKHDVVKDFIPIMQKSKEIDLLLHDPTEDFLDLEQMREKFGNIDYLIVTHIHLDHAGGAGVLIKSMPQARVVVHHRGAKHLLEPTRLVNSMVQALGEEAMAMFGVFYLLSRNGCSR